MDKVQRIKELLTPYSDVIIFMVTLLAANYFWKFTMLGDESGEQVTWFGLDLTAFFEAVTVHVTTMVYRFVSLFRDTAYRVNDVTIRFLSGSGTSIVWGCTGIKQSFIFFWLILTVRPVRIQISNLKFQIAKLLYIPAGWLCCYLFNILRIGLITLFMEFHPSWFPLLHDWIFKYLFYFMLFCLWWFFVEKIRHVALKR